MRVMATAAETRLAKIGYPHKGLAPPASLQPKTRNKVLLLLQALWLLILVLPCALWNIIRILFPPRKKSLKDKVVLVTGAGRGLGKGLSLQFAAEGCKVAVADIDIDNAEQTAADIVKAGGQAKAFKANVASIEEVRELQKNISRDLGEVDILVNNAGLIHTDPLEKLSDEAIRTVISVNLTSHFWMAREFLPAMKRRNSGHIVAIASISSFAGISNGSAYVATKFGVRGFMEVLEAELKSVPGNKIKTTTVFPYFINTSADYLSQWNLRIAPLSIDEAVEGIIAAIRREQELAFIPRYQGWFIPLKEIFPKYVIDLAEKTYYCRVRELTAEEERSSLTAAISKTNQA